MFFNTSFLRDDKIFLKIYKKRKADYCSGFVPTYYFNICKVGSRTQLGTCDFRVGFNEKTYYGGNIGYNVIKEYRGNGYAGRAVNLLKKLAVLHGFTYLFITCAPNNIPSKRTCEKCGGKLIRIENLPTYNDLYIRGERKVLIFKFDLSDDINQMKQVFKI